MEAICGEHQMFLCTKALDLNKSSRNNITAHDHDDDGMKNEKMEEEIYGQQCCYDLDGEDPYSTDHFRMYEFKIRKCSRSRSHDWTDCPFAHPGEKARRRDPRRFNYSPEICPEFRRGGGSCSRSDECEFAHGVFECWLHPSRYRTEACKDGKHCKRKVCFFAHSPRQLRILLPENCTTEPAAGCCMFCRCSTVGSPTSTLVGSFSSSHVSSRSPSSSPPVSPSALFSRLRNHNHNHYKGMVSSCGGGDDEGLGNRYYRMMNMNVIRVMNTASSSKDEDDMILANNHNYLQCDDPDLGWVDELLM